jgi:hypothetical protein
VLIFCFAALRRCADQTDFSNHLQKKGFLLSANKKIAPPISRQSEYIAL